MRTATFVTIARAVASLCQALNLILLARGVDPAEFGITSAYVGICMFGVVGAELGASTMILRYGRTARDGDPEHIAIVRSAYVSTWLQGLAASVVAPLIGLLLFPHLSVLFLACGALWLLTERVFETVFCGFLAEDQVIAANAILVTRRVAALLAQVVLLANGIGGSTAFALSLVVGAAVGALPLVRARLAHLAFVGRPYAFPLKESLGFWIASISSQSRDLETPVVNHVAGMSQAGLHSVGYRLQRPVSLLAMSLAQVVLPKVSASQGTARVEATRVWQASAIAVGLTAVGLPFVPPVVGAVLGESYLPATPVVQASLLFAVPFAFSAPIGAILQAVGESLAVARLGVGLAVVSLGATALGANAGGALGATIACGLVYVLKYAWLSALAARLGRAPRLAR